MGVQKSEKTCLQKRLYLKSYTCTCESGKYLGSITAEILNCDEIIEATKIFPTKTLPIKAVLTKTITAKPVPTNLNEKRVTCNTENFYVLLTFLLIIVSLFIIVSIYCCLIKHRSKQKHLLPYYETSNKFFKRLILMI